VIADTAVVLDACVLIPMPLADTLLRLAETPSLYAPRWSAEILAEVSRNLIAKIGLTPAQAQWREEQLRAHFPESQVTDFEHLIPAMQNHEKDRHVLAAAVQAGAGLIVTFNVRDFPTEVLRPLGVERQGPSVFLCGLYDLEPDTVA
jgi:predicted nucleic acid-binding protein